MNGFLETSDTELEELGEANEVWWNNSFKDDIKPENSEEIENNFTRYSSENTDKIRDCPKSPELISSSKKSKKHKLSSICNIETDVQPSTSCTDTINEKLKFDVLLKSDSSSSDSKDYLSNIQSLVGQQNELSWSSELQSPLYTDAGSTSPLNNQEKQPVLLNGFDNTEDSEVSYTKDSIVLNGSSVIFNDSSEDKKLTVQNKTGKQNFEKACCRKLKFGSPVKLLDNINTSDQNNGNYDLNNSSTCVKTDNKLVKHKNSLQDVPVPTAVKTILENLISPIVSQKLSNIDKKTDVSDLNKDNLILDRNITENLESAYKSQVTENNECLDTDIYTQKKLCSDNDTASKDQVHEISFRALEDIFQASEIFTPSCCKSFSEPLTAIDLKKSIKTVPTSTPINHKFDENLQKDNSFCKKISTHNVDRNTSNDELKFNEENTSTKGEKDHNNFSIYSVISNKFNTDLNSSSVRDILQSAKILEDAEYNRKTSIQKEKIKIFEEMKSKSKGFLQFNNLKILEPDKFNEKPQNLVNTRKNYTQRRNRKSKEKTKASHVGKCNKDLIHDNNNFENKFMEVTDTQMFRIGEEAERNENILSKNYISDSQMYKAGEELDGCSNIYKNELMKNKIKTNRKFNVLPKINEQDIKIKSTRESLGASQNELPVLNSRRNKNESNLKTMTDNCDSENSKSLPKFTEGANTADSLNTKTGKQVIFSQTEELVNEQPSDDTTDSNSRAISIRKSCVHNTGNLIENIKESSAKNAETEDNLSTELVKDSELLCFSGKSYNEAEATFIKKHFIDNAFTQLNLFETTSDSESYKKNLFENMSKLTDIEAETITNKLDSQSVSPECYGVLHEPLNEGSPKGETKISVSDEYTRFSIATGKSVSISAMDSNKSDNMSLDNRFQKEEKENNFIGISVGTEDNVKRLANRYCKQSEVWSEENSDIVIKSPELKSKHSISHAKINHNKRSKTNKKQIKKLKMTQLVRENDYGKLSTVNDKSKEFLTAMNEKFTDAMEINLLDGYSEICEKYNKREGFTTASGNSRNVSKEALMKVKHLSADGELEKYPKAFELKTKVLNTGEQTTKLRGFSTASGKSVSVSEEALSKVKHLFADDELDKCSKAFELKAKVQSTGEQTTKFGGFSTASGKSVSVSKEALSKVKHLFADDELDKCPKAFELKEKVLNTEEQTTKFGGFSTASGKSVSVSKEALSKVKHLFADDELDKCPKAFELKAKVQSTGEQTTKFGGFSTASGKSVSVSKEALSKVKHLFADDELDKCPKAFELKAKVQSTGEQATKFGGFSTASGKSVSVSKEALSKVKHLFADDELDKCPKAFELKAKVQSTGEQTTKFGGFSTASGKSVSVSKEALSKVKHLFADDELDKCPKAFELKAKVQSTGEQTTKFGGFSTASGKSVSVSKEALSKVKHLFADDELDKCSKAFELKAKVQSTGEQATKFGGFSTASGKSVSVSKEALSKVKHLFADDELDKFPKAFDLKAKVQSTGEQTTKFGGFSTASGKSVSVSKEALSKVKHLFADDELDKCPKAFEPKAKVQSTGEQTTKFGGFSTASGKSVSVSEEALSKVKHLFADDELDKCPKAFELKAKVQNTEEQTTKFGGFSTASGKSVSVSKEALSKVKHLFADDELDKCPKAFELKKKVLNTEEQTTKFGGFSTASGKSVSVSKEALSKVKHLFADDELDKCPKAFELKEKVLNTEEQTTKFGGFSTASGKSVSVSKEALSKVKHLFADDELDKCPKAFELKAKVQNTGEQTTKFWEFSKACGQSVICSEEVLLKEKQLFTENEIFDQLHFNLPNVTSVVPSTSGPKQTKSTEISNTEQILLNYSTDDTKSHCGSKEKNSTSVKILNEFYNIVNQTDRKIDTFKTNASLKSSEFSKYDGQFGEASSDTAHKPTKFLFEDLVDNNGTINESDCKNEQLIPECDTSNLSGTSSVDILGCGNDKRQSGRQSVDRKDGGDDDIGNNCHANNPSDVTLSVVHEVSESAAAFLYDEDTYKSDIPGWCRTFITSPSFIHERSTSKFSPVISNDYESLLVKRKRIPSPVLGSSDRFKKKRLKTLKNLNFVNNNSPIVFNCSPELSTFKTSTPINLNKILKRRPNTNDTSTCLPVAKKLKLNDNDLSSQEDERLIQALNITEGRKKAAEEQNKSILDQTRHVKIYKGILLQQKETAKRTSLHDFVKGLLPQKYTINQLRDYGVKMSVIEVTSENAVNFRFCASDYYSTEVCDKNIEGIPVGDSAVLILDGAGKAGVEEFTRAFLASPNVDPSLISKEWVKNHYRWIVWKLASMERSFPTIFANNSLTPNNLMLQLKYRYDREIDGCQRPPLRKILETDEAPSRRIIICVYNTENAEKNEIGITDGWYSVTATIDNEFVDLIQRGKISVGTKLVVHGAELMNCEQGCDVLKVGDDIRLKLHSNSIRRARWDARLGFLKQIGPLLIKLDSILPKGGVVGQVEVVIARSYPIVYRKKLEDGKSVLLSSKAEEKESRLHQQKLQQQTELIFSQIQKEMESERRKKSKKSFKRFSNEEFQSVLSPDKLIEFTENSPDLLGLLTTEQQDVISRYRNEERERMHQALQDRLAEKLGETKQTTTIPILKLRLVQLNNSDKAKWKSVILTIWRPSEELQSYLSEGSVVNIYNVSASGCRNGELQLTSGRQTKYSVTSHTDSVQRVVSSLKSLNEGSHDAKFMEIDVVGVVIHISNSTSVQTVYISDAKQDMLGITFWGSIKQFGWETMISEKSFLACSNLKWRAGNASWHIPSCYVSEVSWFTLNPKQSHLLYESNRLKEEIKDLNGFVMECREKLFSLLKQRESGGLNLIKSSKSSVGDVNVSLVNPANNRPCISTTPAKNLTEEITNKKSSLIKGKIKKLDMYGEPPPISNLIASISSPLVKRDFKSPMCKDSRTISVNKADLENR